MLERSRAHTSCGWQVFKATGAGLCFLVAAIGVAGVLTGMADALSEPRPTGFDWLHLATALIVLGILGGAVVFVRLGLSVVDDFLPPRGLASRPLRYAVTAVAIPALAAIAIPLLPVTLLAGFIVGVLGPVLDRLLARRCLDCAMARQGAVVLNPVFCDKHDRFFGGDAYRLFVSRDLD